MDREKVIKGLEICINRIPGKYTCNECPYEIDGNYCEINLAKDALALLKEQEAKTVELIMIDRSLGEELVGYCPSCDKLLKERFNKFFCGNCGQAVKWK